MLYGSLQLPGSRPSCPIGAPLHRQQTCNSCRLLVEALAGCQDHLEGWRTKQPCMLEGLHAKLLPVNRQRGDLSQA